MKTRQAKSRFILSLVVTLVVLSAGWTTRIRAQDDTRLDQPLRVCSRIQAGDRSGPFIASDNDNTIILLSTVPSLRKLSVSGLRNSWTTDSGGRIVGSPGTLRDGTVFGLFESGDAFVLRHFSAESGLSREIRRFPRSEFPAASVLDDDLLLLSTASGAVAGVSTLTGSRTWLSERPGLSVTDAVAIGDGRIMLKAADGFSVLRRDDGAVEGHLPGSEYVRVFGGDDEAGVFALAQNGEFVLVDPRNGEARWRFRTGGIVTGAVGVGESVVFGSTDNFVYRLNLRRGTLDWKSRIGDRVLDPPVVADEFFFVPNRLGMSVEIHSLRTGKLVNSLPVDDGMRIIAVIPGADGTVVIVTPATVYHFSKSCPE